MTAAPKAGTPSQLHPLKSLLVDELRDLLHAEGQLVAALPKMAGAAHNPKLQEAFSHHLEQTEGQVTRLKAALESLGEKASPKPCKAMMGLLEEGKETIESGAGMDKLSADLGLIASAQRVEHYEISAYGTARSLARHIGALDVVAMLSHTLGEEERADYHLTELAKPIMQQASSNYAAAGEPASSPRTKKMSRA